MIRLDKILKIVGEANPRAKIMYIGLYHPFLDIDANRDGSAVVEKNGIMPPSDSPTGIRT